MKNIPKIIFWLLLTVPLIEIYLFIAISSVLGLLTTLCLLIVTAFMGSLLIRRQGLNTWSRLQTSLTQGMMPTLELVEGLLLFISGLLLLIPGFLSDTLALLGLITPVRRILAHKLMTMPGFMPMNHYHTSSHARSKVDILEGEFTREDSR